MFEEVKLLLAWKDKLATGPWGSDAIVQGSYHMSNILKPLRILSEKLNYSCTTNHSSI